MQHVNSQYDKGICDLYIISSQFCITICLQRNISSQYKTTPEQTLAVCSLLTNSVWLSLKDRHSDERDLIWIIYGNLFAWLNECKQSPTTAGASKASQVQNMFSQCIRRNSQSHLVRVQVQYTKKTDVCLKKNKFNLLK